MKRDKKLLCTANHAFPLSWWICTFIQKEWQTLSKIELSRNFFFWLSPLGFYVPFICFNCHFDWSQNIYLVTKSCSMSTKSGLKTLLQRFALDAFCSEAKHCSSVLRRDFIYILQLQMYLEFSECVLPKTSKIFWATVLWYLRSTCFRSFFGRIEDAKKSFRNELTFRKIYSHSKSE